jgi:hypothetical protein
MNERAATTVAPATRTIHGVPHIECKDCGDVHPHYDMVGRSDGYRCHRCDTAPKPSARMSAGTLRALLLHPKKGG